MPSTLREAVVSARSLHASGAGTVLDNLLRSAGLAPTELSRQLGEGFGVLALSAEDQATPDFSTMPLADARQLRAVPLRLASTGGLVLGMADPWDDGASRKAAQMLGQMPALAAVTTNLLRLSLGEQPPGELPATVSGGPPARTESGPVVDFVDAALKAAMAEGASDVHFECDRSGVTVKLRQDGVMVNFARMEDVDRAQEVISRIKVLAQLDITERRVPQDGRFRFSAAAQPMDLRVSIMPSVHGEDAVLRLLDKAQLRGADSRISLRMLGFDSANAEGLHELAALPHGMLLVTGPTGSGKTTTVYAVLSEINSGLEKIITIEDPVEYELPGVLQIPVNERKGLTFAKGLRSILRHDPDRILVGEIRDSETAEIAVQSALTGHQVFTTVHANSIFDVMGRFKHFGLDMFGFMSALNGLVVQRLVRRLCTHCAGRRAASERERHWLAEHELLVDELPLAQGCPACHGSGYKGRMVLAEVHVVDDGMRDLVTSSAPVSALRAHVAALGVVPLGRWGARMVAVHGQTTAEEVRRVVGWR